MIPIRRDRRTPTFTRITSRTNTNFYCCVGGCRNTQKDARLSFFALPREVDRRNAWLKLIGRKDLLKEKDFSAYKVCSKHFNKSSITEWFARILLPNAVPTRHLPSTPRLIIMEYYYEEGFSDAATQTDITYGSDLARVKVETGLFNDFYIQPSTPWAEPKYAIPHNNTFVVGNLKREYTGGENKENKKRKY